MADFTNEQVVFDTLRDKLTTPLVGDTLDVLGFCEQVMRPEITPVYPGAVVIGRAYPIITVDIYEPGDEFYIGLPETIDCLKPGDVVVIGGTRSTNACIWGDLASTAAQGRGATGAVLDGYTRDIPGIVEIKFPVFSGGIAVGSPYGRAKVLDRGCPVRCGGVLVRPGDIVFGDINGVVVIPKEVVQKAMPAALERAGGEDMLRQRLLKGELFRKAYDECFKGG